MKFGNYLVALVIAAVAPIALAAEPLFVDGDTVREVQQTLRDRGFRVGVDGIMGPRTQAALRLFQKSENLEETGRLNPGTLAALGMEAQPLASGAKGSQ
jgi:peptidoglycan hydrolase-like protein with peptidoglycan-binding domain